MAPRRRFTTVVQTPSQQRLALRHLPTASSPPPHTTSPPLVHDIENCVTVKNPPGVTSEQVLVALDKHYPSLAGASCPAPSRVNNNQNGTNYGGQEMRDLVTANNLSDVYRLHHPKGGDTTNRCPIARRLWAAVSPSLHLVFGDFLCPLVSRSERQRPITETEFEELWEFIQGCTGRLASL
ncbi:BQ2448_2871 [Microbotryum intermedium]|uniref:BQ2448_2871 protein n=1 Tax=Microbotryum intermedium TaxID=269621 RepID=A0A238FH02_9BASI|nr:BQ2448_2871 [Microbotryum intermedium]